ncbi:1-aminocyclopropane-1-carboxylate synthase 2-like [Nicotiana tabacum]|uniref:1-aminocyclopropane-1-carboxylate synthase 2-like n=1 Tax=Nicotiana tabacum TaxID=4097 RepID=A0AC58S6V8_TOBAC
MDLRPLLKEPTFDSEMALWKLIINDSKLNVSPGFSFNCPEPGWFRVCFANIDDQTVEIALGRIRKLVENGVKNKQQWESNNLRLMISGSMYAYFDESFGCDLGRKCANWSENGKKRRNGPDERHR